MTIQEIKNHLDKIQISDLQPRYNISGGGRGSTSIPDWQYEMVVKSNILNNTPTRGFDEPIKRFDIRTGAIKPLSDLLKGFLKKYLV